MPGSAGDAELYGCAALEPAAAFLGIDHSKFGVGAAQTFTAVYSDTNGADDLSTVGVLINSSLSSAHGCYLAYSLGTNALNVGSMMVPAIWEP